MDESRNVKMERGESEKGREEKMRKMDEFR